MVLRRRRLEGRVVSLVPLSLRHVEPLFEVSRDPAIWRFLPYGEPRCPAALRRLVEGFLVAEARGTDLPFAVYHEADGRYIGMTRLLHLDGPNRAAEVGGTWYAPAYQGRGVNADAKYLLLRLAFEELGCVRVQFKTDARNLRSQRALLALGAVLEGVWRQHLVLPSGAVRDSLYFSVVAREWPSVRAALELRRGRGAGQGHLRPAPGPQSAEPTRKSLDDTAECLLVIRRLAGT